MDELFNGEKRRQEEQEQQQQELSARYSASLAASIASTKNAAAAGMFSSWSDPRAMLQNSNTVIQPGMITHVQSQGREWFEEERKRLSEMTDRALKKLKRDKSK